MKQFEIYLEDLTPTAQKVYLEFAGVKSPDELNHEYIPIAIIDMEKEEEEVI